MALDPVPNTTPINAAESKLWQLQQVWYQWLNRLRQMVNAAVGIVGDAALTAQAASIAATALNPGTLAAGLYRASYAVQVTRASSATSGIQVLLAWTSGGVAQSFSGTNLTTNLTTTHEGQSVTMLVDASTNVTYATTYASTGVTTMQYALGVVLEAL